MFWAHCIALARKNGRLQARKWAQNLGIVLTPLLVTILLAILQRAVDNELTKSHGGKIFVSSTPAA